MLLILIGVVINMALTIRLSVEVKVKIAEVQQDKSLPCAAIPTRYILQEPECADKLLRAMNVTNVRVVVREEGMGRVNEFRRTTSQAYQPKERVNILKR